MIRNRQLTTGPYGAENGTYLPHPPFQQGKPHLAAWDDFAEVHLLSLLWSH